MKKLYKTLLTPLMLLAISGCSAIGSDSIKGDDEFADSMSYVSGGDVISPEAPGGEDGEDEPNEEVLASWHPPTNEQW